MVVGTFFLGGIFGEAMGDLAENGGVEEAESGVDDVLCHCGFGFERVGGLFAVGAVDSYLVGVATKAGTGILERVEHNHIQSLGGHLVQGVGFLVLRLECKADERLSG